LLRFVPAYQTTEAWSFARGVIQYAERRALAVSIVVMVVGALVDLVPAIFAASLVLGRHTDAPLVMTATLVGSIAALGLASLAMRRLRPGVLTIILPEYAAATWRHTAVPLVIIAAAEALLSWFGETREAGIYNLAFNIAFLVVLPRTAINILFAPTISSLFTLRDQVAKAASWTLCAAVCIALVLAQIAEWHATLGCRRRHSAIWPRGGVAHLGITNSLVII
jgi:hypothetical protein